MEGLRKIQIAYMMKRAREGGREREREREREIEENKESPFDINLFSNNPFERINLTSPHGFSARDSVRNGLLVHLKHPPRLCLPIEA